MSAVCAKLHELLTSLPRFHFPFDVSLIPLNGIYILFEDGELAHGTDRIVRVGTHNGDNRLSKRLIEHFVKENKDRSIFRKNIGRALLKRANDPFLAQWEIDLMSREARRVYGDSVDKARLKEVEGQVTNYMRSHFSFVVVPLSTFDARHLWESRLISTVGQCKDCIPSVNWLGHFSPREEIRTSGLWNVQGLNKTPMNDEELERLRKMVNK
jgi:hypothetical protein